jgi:hypothetical protein
MKDTQLELQKTASLSFLAEAQPRLKTGEDKRQFLVEVHNKFFRRQYELQSNTITYLHYLW